jgi:outer membrane immunogenic protein
MKRISIASAALATLLAAASASAADLPAYTKAPAVAAVFDWTGPYIGTNLGYSWGRGTTDGTYTNGSLVAALTTVTPISGRADVNGFVGGGQLGYNWQFGSWVTGLEGDIQVGNERGSGLVACTVVCAAGSTFGREYKLDWFGTARGRVGYLPAERLLLYVTGGLAYGSFSGSSLIGVSGANALDFGSWSRVQAGWTVGAGVESALGYNWSVKFEYLYINLGQVGGTSAIVGLNQWVFNTKFTDSIARVGVNYHFSGPVVAKY